MKPSFLKSIRFILMLCFSIVVITTLKSTILGQCSNPPQQFSLTTTWKVSAVVNVVIDPGFNSTKYATIVSQLGKWSNVGISNVTFSVTATPGPGASSGGNPVLFISNDEPDSATAQGQTSGFSFGACRGDSFIKIHPNISDSTAFTHVVSHELGHTFGLADCASCPQNSSAMTLPTSGGLNGAGGSDGPTTCDVTQFRACYVGPTPSPTPTPSSPPIPPVPPPTSCNSPSVRFQGASCPIGYTADWTGYYCCTFTDPGCEMMQQECEASGGTWKGCNRGCYSPIVIDVSGNGFDLTDGQNGVYFDLTGEGLLNKISWTAPTSDDAWLALDRNGNGKVDSGMELFGNFTDQPQTTPVADRNGFLALGVYDLPQNGGNNDGQITAQDDIFDDLRLWRDANQNGVSEASELQNLSASPVRRIDLNYKTSKRTDVHGNRFVYRSRVRDGQGNQVGRWAWDVFLLRGKY